MLALFHDKKCCNCFNFIPCIFMGFYSIRFSIKLVKNRVENENQYISRLACEKFMRRVPAKRACEKHMTGS